MTVAAELAPRSGVCIAVDCMGGDHGPSATLPACRAFLAAHPDAALILVGRIEALAPAREWPRCTLVAATEVVEMDDPIEVALRRKRDSSLRVAISQVKAGADGTSAAQACVSAGNTGALMAVSRYVLKTLDGIDRPAIAAVMPNQCGGYTTVLDLGANVDCTAEHLLQFAVMGSALVAAVAGTPNPSVGLLNQDRTSPWPSTIHFSDVRPSNPTGPRACSLSVEMPISAPRPYSKPSAKRVLALTITLAESTSRRKRIALG